jgi:hypothetical protein
MTQPTTISIERLTPKIREITFSSPPANLIVPETVSRLPRCRATAALPVARDRLT